MTPEAFKNGAESLRNQLVGTARKYLSNADEVEDIVQDAMLKLWLMHEKINPPINGLAAVVTHNLCIDYLRRKHPAIDIAKLQEKEDISDDGEQIEQMLQIIDTLPSTQRTILKMRHLEGMQMSEIAMVLGSTEVAVRKTLSRARMAVRRKLIAVMAAACLITAVSVLTVYCLKQEQQEEFVAYVYGKKYTDKTVVMQEMKRTIGDITENNPQDEIENQLIELFSE